MNLILILLFLVSVVWVFSQFGGNLKAQHSLFWWSVFAFLTVAIVFPDALAPIAVFLGIHVVSNMVFGIISLLLIFHAVQESVFTTLQSRKLREVVSGIAAQQYLDKNPIRKSKKPQALVVLPCYNEEKSLPECIAALETLIEKQSNAVDLNYCFVNDGSRDLSEEILESAIPNRFVTHLSNVGVAGVLLTGFKILQKGHFDYLIQCDADGQHPIDQIPSLISTAMELQTDLLIGSRYYKKKMLKHESSTYLRRFGTFLVSRVLLFFGKTFVTDPTSGFRVYSKEAALFLIRRMPDEYPEPETIALLGLGSFKIREIGMHMYARKHGVSSLAGGMKSLQYMLKVFTAVIGLRLRSLF
jgi:hypothetical protein